MTNNKHAKPIHPTILNYINNIDIAEKYDAFFRDSQLFRFDCEFLHDNIPTPARVLDLGCGTARHMLFLESLGFDTYGIDLSKHFLKISKQKRINFGYTNQRLIHADIMHLPLNKHSKFECILLMFSVLGLIQGSSNRERLLSSLHAHLSLHGKIIVHIHNYEFKHSVLARTLKKLNLRGSSHKLLESGDKIVANYRGIQDIYIHSFTLKEIRDLFARTGYKICNVVGLNANRDGPCRHKNIRENANGFLIAATKR